MIIATLMTFFLLKPALQKEIVKKVLSSRETSRDLNGGSLTLTKAVDFYFFSVSIDLSWSLDDHHGIGLWFFAFL